MATQTATRTIDGVEAPRAGTWTIDAAHSSVEVIARHLMLAKVRGRFGSFAGEIVVGDTPEDSSVEVTIDAASIDTGETKRDEHLRSPDFLDVENHPTLTFRSSGARRTSERTLEVDGDLTIRGVARPVTLDVEYLGVTQDPWGNTRAAFSATTEIDREEFGITWNQALETGGVMVGRKLKVELEVSAVHSG